jgi:hypothetical protein
MKVLKYTREILILGLVLVVILMFVKPCGKAKQLDAYGQLQEKTKSLEAKVKADSIIRAAERQAFAKEKQETEGKRLLAETEKTESDKKVQQQQKTIDRLAGIVRSSNNSSNSSNNSVSVTTEYKRACDSLPAEIDKLNIALANKDSAINEWSSILAYEIQIRDEEIYREMNYSDSLKADFNRQTTLLKSALKIAKPRGRFLAGAGVLGNHTTFLSGAKIALAYQSKGGKQYQGEAMIIRGEAYYGGTVLITLFK